MTPRDVIMSFDGQYAFLSNFYESPIPVIIHDTEYIAPTVEHAFQAWKTMDTEEMKWVLASKTPGEAKRRGRKVNICSNWELIKDGVMENFVREKFRIPALRDKLLATSKARLVEGNHWHDNTWGICCCPKCINNPDIKGENKLGEILMKIREEIQEEQDYIERIIHD